MNKKLITTGLLASLLIIGSANQILDSSLSAQAVATQQQQGMQLVSLGASLTQAQAQQTLQLLGAGHVPASSITYVDGNMVNRYLSDGSNANTTVLSSAYISSMPDGYGVRVNVVTPQNITFVTSTTYQNAAITAGVKNAQLNIATVAPVTGEGALAGIYAILESQGTLKQADAQAAQKEIQVINNIQTNTQINTQITNNQINVIIADIKVLINEKIQLKQEVNVHEIVSLVMKKYNLDDAKLLEELIVIAENFKETDAAQDAGTAEQLQASISENWFDQLNTITETQTAEELIGKERKTYTDQAKYHAIIQKFSDKFYQLIEQNGAIDELYSHTFVFERLNPTLKPEERQALNELRTLMYQYKASKEVTPGETKDYWTGLIGSFDILKGKDASLTEIYNKIAMASGLAPEAYTYSELTQNDSKISVKISDDSRPEKPVLGVYVYDLNTGEVFVKDSATDALIPLSAVMNFNGIYGVNVDNNYMGMTIANDYAIEGYVREQSSSSTTSSQESVSSSDESEMFDMDEALINDMPFEEDLQPELIPGDPASEQATDATITPE